MFLVSRMVYVSAALFPLLHCLLATHTRGTGGRVRTVLKTRPGGVSRGGSSLSRDERWDRLSNIGRSFLKNLNGVFEKRTCSLDNPNDLQRLLPGRFMSEDDLYRMVPVSRNWIADSPGQQYSPARRLVVNPPNLAPLPEPPFERQAAAFDTGAFRTSNFFGQRSSQCGCCFTEIGYEVVDQVMDFSGVNHTVVNFNNAYQFIPSGRCVNENSPCGGGGSARCKQIMRAHWSLVYTPGRGVNLVAHEVPSHCECINFGSQEIPLRTAQLQTREPLVLAAAKASGRQAVKVAGLDVHMDEKISAPASSSVESTTTSTSDVTSTNTVSANTSSSTASTSSAPSSTSSTPGPL